MHNTILLCLVGLVSVLAITYLASRLWGPEELPKEDWTRNRYLEKLKEEELRKGGFSVDDGRDIRRYQYSRDQ